MGPEPEAHNIDDVCIESLSAFRTLCRAPFSWPFPSFCFNLTRFFIVFKSVFHQKVAFEHALNSFNRSKVKLNRPRLDQSFGNLTRPGGPKVMKALQIHRDIVWKR